MDDERRTCCPAVQQVTRAAGTWPRRLHVLTEDEFHRSWDCPADDAIQSDVRDTAKLRALAMKCRAEERSRLDERAHPKGLDNFATYG